MGSREHLLVLILSFSFELGEHKLFLAFFLSFSFLPFFPSFFLCLSRKVKLMRKTEG